MPRMSEQNRAIAIGLLEANFSVNAVARRMGVTPKVIRKLRERFQNTQEVKDRPRTGCPRVCKAGSFGTIVPVVTDSRGIVMGE